MPWDKIGQVKNCRDLSRNMLLVRNRNLAALQNAWQEKERMYEQRVNELERLNNEKNEKLVVYENVFQSIETLFFSSEKDPHASSNDEKYSKLPFISGTLDSLKQCISQRLDNLRDEARRKENSVKKRRSVCVKLEDDEKKTVDLEIMRLRCELEELRKLQKVTDYEKICLIERFNKLKVRFDEWQTRHVDAQEDKESLCSTLDSASSNAREQGWKGQLNDSIIVELKQKLYHYQHIAEHPSNAFVFSTAQYKRLSALYRELTEENIRINNTLNDSRKLINEQRTHFENLLKSYHEADRNTINQLSETINRCSSQPPSSYSPSFK